MAAQSKCVRVTAEISQLPSDYPFDGLVKEPLADYAARVGMNLRTIQRQADRGKLPILQDGKKGRRYVNLYALYLASRYQAERYVAATVASHTRGNA